MTLAYELASLAISWAQEISIVVGVGALTITLIGHLLALHAHQNETARGYVRAAHQLRALALAVIIVSGAGAVLVHLSSGTLGVLLAPAFSFKWMVVALLIALQFLEWKVSGWKQDAIEGFEGANWYALLLVHTLAPVAAWGTILALYGGWLAAFGALWATFVLVMRRQTTLAPKAAPAPVEKKIEAHPNHSLLPMVAELDLPATPAPIKVEETRVEEPAPKEEPGTFSQEIPQKPMPELETDHAVLPALQVMPRHPEDIEASKRGPVVKLGE